MARRRRAKEAVAPTVERRVWEESRSPRDLASLPPLLLEDMKQWMELTPPMPDVTEVRMCGCKDEPWGRVVLCNRHEGFFAALETGYSEGYFDALNTVDRIEREQIAGQEALPRDGLSEPVRVPLWVALCAIRYGMVRHTYACGDAARLAFEFWTQFPDHIKDQIRNDVKRVDSVCSDDWAWMYYR